MLKVKVIVRLSEEQSEEFSNAHGDVYLEDAIMGKISDEGVTTLDYDGHAAVGGGEYYFYGEAEDLDALAHDITLIEQVLEDYHARYDVESGEEEEDED